MKPVNLHHGMLSWEWFDDSFCVHIMCFLLLQAKQSATTFKGHKVKRGQVVAGRGKIATGTSIPEQIVRTRMKRMIESGDFSVQVIEADGRKFSLITITNYSEYQKNEPAKRETTEYMKEREKLKNNHYSKPFEKWFAVHKKGSKGGAWIEWQKTTGKPDVEDLIRTDLQYQEYCKSMDRPLIDGERWMKRRFFDSEWTHEAQGTQPDEGGASDVTFGG